MHTHCGGPQLCTQTPLYRSVHHLPMQSSNTQVPKVTHGYQSPLGSAAHAPNRNTHTRNRTHAHTRRWGGQWPRSTQSQGETGSSVGQAHRIRHRLCGHLTEEGVPSSLPRNIQIRALWPHLSPLRLVINTHRCVCENRLSGKATSKHNTGGKT